MKEVLILFGIILAVLGNLMFWPLARPAGRAERREEILLKENESSKNQKEDGLCLVEEK